jgi:iron complex transport system substrate-binding protein
MLSEPDNPDIQLEDPAWLSISAEVFESPDTHSGSLSMSPEQIIAKGNQVDVWAFKYFGGNALTKQDLLAEYQGYQALKAFQTGTVYETDTSCEPYFELTSFHPEILLREFIILSHPEAGDKFGKLRFYKKY